MATSRNTEELLQQMRQIRSELRDDVEGMVDRAQVMTDWHYYVKNYPLVCLGAAFAAGYFLIPTRVKIVERANQQPLPREEQHFLHSAGAASKPKTGGMMSMLAGMVASALIQSATAVARKQLDVFLQGQLQQASPSSSPQRRDKPSGNPGNHKAKRQEYN